MTLQSDLTILCDQIPRSFTWASLLASFYGCCQAPISATFDLFIVTLTIWTAGFLYSFPYTTELLSLNTVRCLTRFVSLLTLTNDVRSLNYHYPSTLGNVLPERGVTCQPICSGKAAGWFLYTLKISSFICRSSRNLRREYDVIFITPYLCHRVPLFLLSPPTHRWAACKLVFSADFTHALTAASPIKSIIATGFCPFMHNNR